MTYTKTNTESCNYIVLNGLGLNGYVRTRSATRIYLWGAKSSTALSAWIETAKRPSTTARSAVAKQLGSGWCCELPRGEFFCILDLLDAWKLHFQHIKRVTNFISVRRKLSFS